MGALSWIRFARRVPGLVRQQELPNLEALLETEAGKQPYNNYFVLSCAIPAGVFVFGGGTVFAAWLSGVSGIPLVLGSVLTALLMAGSWFLFYRLWKSVPDSKKKVRRLTMRLLERYNGLANILGADRALAEPVAEVLEEAAGIYLKHSVEAGASASEAEERAVRALDEAMGRLLELTEPKEAHAQERTLAAGWAQPILDEMRQLDAVLDRYENARRSLEQEGPVSALRHARMEIEGIGEALEELDGRRQPGLVEEETVRLEAKE